jgi:hypothetical protein
LSQGASGKQKRKPKNARQVARNNDPQIPKIGFFHDGNPRLLNDIGSAWNE